MNLEQAVVIATLSHEGFLCYEIIYLNNVSTEPYLFNLW